MPKYTKPIGKKLISTSSDLTTDMNDRVKKYQQTLDEILQANEVACSFIEVKRLPLSIVFKYKIESFTFKKSVLTDIEEMLPVYLNCQEASIEFISSEMAFAIKVSNDERSYIPLGNLIYSEEYKKIDGNTKFILGVGKDNEPIIMDLIKSKNILILGDNETEKINMLKTIITSMLMNSFMDSVQFRIIDSHAAELEKFSKCKNFIYKYNSDKYDEYENYWMMSNIAELPSFVRGIMREEEEYNFEKLNKKLNLKKMICPYTIVIVNNLDELINSQKDSSDARKFLRIITNEKVNNTGTYYIITANQLDVGLSVEEIRKTFPTRITFNKKNSYAESKLNICGQSELFGNGDGLYAVNKENKFNRFQAATVAEDDIELLIEYIETEAIQP